MTPRQRSVSSPETWDNIGIALGVLFAVVAGVLLVTGWHL